MDSVLGWFTNSQHNEGKANWSPRPQRYGVRKFISLDLCFDSAWANLSNMLMNFRHRVCLLVLGHRNGIVKMFRLTAFGIKCKVGG